MSAIRIGVVGASGKMGRTLLRTVAEAEGAVIAGATERKGSPAIGTDIGTLAGLPPMGITVIDDPVDLFVNADAVLDFTSPAATVDHAALAAQARIVHVIGTTGLDAEHEAKIKAAARHATIIKSGNMSLGVNLLAALVRQAAKALDTGFDIEVVEMHHRQKVDSPSGTALLLGKAAAEGRGQPLETLRDPPRDGINGPRIPGKIGFASLRGGTVVGDHRVILAGDHEQIELTHIATDRSIFAKGALKAAFWGQGKGPGLFSMADVLGVG